jgi:hypothetical protein
LRSKDSVLIKAAITDTSGLASFQQVLFTVLAKVSNRTKDLPVVQAMKCNGWEVATNFCFCLRIKKVNWRTLPLIIG